MKALTEFTLGELEQAWIPAGIQKLRARQAMAWVWRKGALSFEEMTDLPKPLRETLARDYAVVGSEIAERPRSRDATQKYLLRLSDGRFVECVLIPAEDGRLTACLSSQVGCPLACGFCASGLDGVERNLTSGEILDQYLLLNRAAAAMEGTAGHITNIVFMGMGEPLLNFESVRRAVEILTEEGGRGGGLSVRRITISTSGIVPGIDRLSEWETIVRLSVSLHAPRDELRTRIMPVNRRWPIAALMESLRRYEERTGRFVTFEYILLDGVNDSLREAAELADLVSGCLKPCKVNLIPFNPVPETPYGTPPRERCRAFANLLLSRGIRTTLRVRKGADIDAACGQLRLRKRADAPA